MDDFETVIDPVDGTTWRVDGAFLSSNWTCIWDRGCEGILDRPAASLGQGCCSLGAELIDDDEAMRVGALAMTLEPDRFQHHDAAEAGGVFADDQRRHTRVVDGACIFLNRPGFEGGHGCALHLGATDDGDSPIDWKPTVCWQVPLRVDDHGDGTKTLRPWLRSDIGATDDDMAWCCTARDETSLASAYVGSAPVADSLSDELRGIVGPEVAVELQRRFGGG